MLLIDESLKDDGSPHQMYLAVGASAQDSDAPETRRQVRVIDDRAVLGAISVGTLARLMRRYGRPLDREITGSSDALDDVLELSGQRSIARLQFRAAVDAASRDYVVWREPGCEPLAALGRQIASALRFVLRRARP